VGSLAGGQPLLARGRPLRLSLSLSAAGVRPGERLQLLTRHQGGRNCRTWCERKFWSAFFTVVALAGIVVGAILLGIGAGQSSFVQQRDADQDFAPLSSLCMVEEVWARLIEKQRDCGKNCRMDICHAQIVYTFSGPLDGNGSPELSTFRLGSGVGYEYIRSEIEVHDNNDTVSDRFTSIERTTVAGNSTSMNQILSRHTSIELHEGMYVLECIGGLHREFVVTYALYQTSWPLANAQVHDV